MYPKIKHETTPKNEYIKKLISVNILIYQIMIALANNPKSVPFALAFLVSIPKRNIPPKPPVKSPKNL